MRTRFITDEVTRRSPDIFIAVPHQERAVVGLRRMARQAARPIQSSFSYLCRY